MANWEQLNFQNRFSPNIEQLIFLHDHIMRILVLITSMVLYISILFMTSKNSSIKITENHNLEIIWTFLPGLVLILIAFPSLRLLYTSEEIDFSPISMKIIGHQWYWSYEYSNFKEVEFDSFIIPANTENTFRLLETDNYLVLPEKIYTQIFISSTDVLHSWTIPALGIKADSRPGRLNIITTYVNKPGNFYGQCSEICGANHRFIPISLNITNFQFFKTWILSLVKNLLLKATLWTFNSK
jgi:cytochrome c oxidase subunit 2